MEQHRAPTLPGHWLSPGRNSHSKSNPHIGRNDSASYASSRVIAAPPIRARRFQRKACCRSNRNGLDRTYIRTMRFATYCGPPFKYHAVMSAVHPCSLNPKLRRRLRYSATACRSVFIAAVFRTQNHTRDRLHFCIYAYPSACITRHRPASQTGHIDQSP